MAIFKPKTGSVVIGYYLDPLKKNNPSLLVVLEITIKQFSQEQKMVDVYTGFTDNITIPKYAITGQDPDSIKGEPTNKESASARESNTGSSPQ